MAIVAAVKGQEIVGPQHGLQGLVNEHSVHGRFRHRQPLAHSAWAAREARSSSNQGRSCQVCSTLLRSFAAPRWSRRPPFPRPRPGCGYLRGGRVNLDNSRVGCHVWRRQKPMVLVLLAAQEDNYIGVAQHGGGPVQAPLEKSEPIGVVVGHQSPGLSFS